MRRGLGRINCHPERGTAESKDLPHGSATVATLFALTILVGLSSCKQEPRPAEADNPSEIPALAGFSVTEDNPDLLFQYFEPGTGRPVTAKSVDDVPESVRKAVVVFSTALKKGEFPPSQIIVADLSAKGEDGTYPFRLVSRYAPQGNEGEPQAERRKTASSPAGDVLVFTTSWCPHCRTAVNWLKSNKVPFKERNVEQDAGARGELARLGSEAGIPEQMLNTVPILYVRGQLMLGFNPDEVGRLLGR